MISFGMIIIIFVILVILICFWQFMRWVKDMFKPLISSEVKIIEIDRKRSRPIVNGKANITPVYDVTFLLSDDSRVKFALSVLNYEWIAIGDVGVLTTQGRSFVKFVKRLENKGNEV